jgi:hypothetical protein
MLTYKLKYVNRDVVVKILLACRCGIVGRRRAIPTKSLRQTPYSAANFCSSTSCSILAARLQIDIHITSLSSNLRYILVDSVERLMSSQHSVHVEMYRSIRTSSMTTAFPRITTIPMRTFSPPGFSSRASSRTMFR